MKQKFTLLIFSFLIAASLTLSSQVTIGPENLPMINSANVGTSVNNPSLDLGSTGEQSYDFSNLNGQNDTSLILFQPISELVTNAVDPISQYPDATFGWAAPLGSLLGISTEELLPSELNINDPTAYYSTGEDGAVYIEGLTIRLDILGAIEFGHLYFNLDNPYRFWNPASYEDESFSESYFDLQLPASSLPLGLDTFCFEAPAPFPPELCLSSINLGINLATTQNVDAYGSMELPGETYNVLRYNEQTVVNLKLVPWMVEPDPDAEPFEIDLETVPDELWESLEEAIFLDLSTLFLDTTFNRQIHRFYSDEKTFPVATIDSDQGILQSINYLVPPPLLESSFNYNNLVSNFNCKSYTFFDQSEGVASAYSWDFGDGQSSDEANPTHVYDENGTYTVTFLVTDNFGSASSSSQSITVDCIPLTAEFDLIHDDPFSTEIVLINKTEGTYTSHIWYLGDGGVVVNQDSFAYEYESVGSYEISLVVDNFNVESDTLNKTVNIFVTGLEDPSLSNYDLYPNPVQDQLNIVLEAGLEENAKLQLLDLSGKIVAIQDLAAGSQKVQLDVNEMAAGMYLLKIESANKQLLLSDKIIIEQ